MGKNDIFKKMNRLTLILIFLVNISFAQNETFMGDFLIDNELINQNVIDRYDKYDFSNIWMKTKNNLVYGIIGNEYQRVKIKLISIEKTPFNSTEYLVYGKSKVKETVCEFNGVIKIKEIKLLNKLHLGVDSEYEKTLSQGVLIAEYEFQENITQLHSGFFKGHLYSKWYLDSNYQIMYDDILSIADGYFNNAFIGNWTSYKTNKEKICNWADYRVPQANQGFDIGAGEFSVSEKYYGKGWLDTTLNNHNLGNEINQGKRKEWWE